MRAEATMDRSPTARAALLALVLATLACLGVLVAPAGAAHATVTLCVPAPDTGCINGTIRTAAGQPAVGVGLTIDGPAGESAATTGPDGRWSAPVSEAGEYTVTLDEATLPAGETLRDPASNPRTVDVTLGASAPALFPLGEPTASSGTGGSGGAGRHGRRGRRARRRRGRAR